MASLELEGPSAQVSISNLACTPSLREQVEALELECWPRYMLEGGLSARLWPQLVAAWPEYQLTVCDSSGRLLASARSVPGVWDGSPGGLPKGADGALESGLELARNGVVPDTLIAFQVAVSPEARGMEMGSLVLEQARQAARELGMALIIPVRPTRKSSYPLIEIEEYALWRRPDGTPFDPWLRTHLGMGSELIACQPSSRCVVAPASAWESWTGLRIPAGEYVFSDGLVPLKVRRVGAALIGFYAEPNCWIEHLAPGALSAGQRR